MKNNHSRANGHKLDHSSLLEKKRSVSLQKRGYLHFPLGLITSLLLCYFLLEASFTMATPTIETASHTEDLLWLETTPPVIPVKKEIPQKRQTSAVVITDLLTISDIDNPTEDVFTTTLLTDSIEVITPPEIHVIEDPEEVFIFDHVESKPMFAECENVEAKDQLACFKKQLDKHVLKTFKYPLEAKNLQIQGKVYVVFKINKDGTVSIMNTKGPAKLLEAEAERIIEKLPPLIPGKSGGRSVSVSFAYPIVFKLQ
ncbi:energy transducer TonB [Imtechella halotolerans]|uniref:Tonb family protein n=1 Tax=Imtechella halotolerans K1 TaxID=946077 RepID=I0W9F2_9FLAO|nr:energy transducer TonB [Imtechella halotolerans]EID73018.1 tonb family protein [Imtechella halotolerans K1]WMQ62116.1 energy transducer TonB [Imtechella halotolerans]